MKKLLTTWLCAFVCAFLCCFTANAASQTKIYLLVNKNKIHTSVNLSSYFKKKDGITYLQTKPEIGTLTKKGKYTAKEHGTNIVYAIRNNKLIKVFNIFAYRWAAHRGYSAKYCENTEKAFIQAAKNGADVIETDIRMSKDGKLYCYHDSSLNYKTNGYGNIEDNTAKQISKIRYRWGRQKICTFKKFLSICKKYKITPWIHIKKTNDAKHDQTCIKKTIQTLKRGKWSGKVGFVNDELSTKAQSLMNGKYLSSYPRLYDEFCPIDNTRY